ncbi:vacuolar transmembrane tms1p [Phaffia rhodozyma]|uniref:Vacuolar transmembrane tms1p n=1 Tax=Phaffia rhodozyma TaxID=264483 RepID=A0A0F7SFL4_PHARH|nr:vacuolar transmembrane tms1p [Phaffia rhodozyma]
MGALLSIPLLGSLGSLGTSALSGVLFFMSGTAASALFKSCNCNSSIATRVGFAIIFCLNSMLAWLMRTDTAIRQIEKISWDWIKMDCTGGKCYGLLAVHRFCFALGLLHLILSSLLIGVHNTKSKRASIQNGWWGPKVLLWIVLVFLSFLIPNEFFMFWGSYISPVGSSLFILLGLVLLIDFAHTWSETLLESYETTLQPRYQYFLVGSTLLMYILTIAITIVLFVFFGGSGCGLNTFFISANVVLVLVITISSVLPAVQESNPKSGLAQASMLSIYSTYLVASAVANHSGPNSSDLSVPNDHHSTCNPITSNSSGARTTTVIMGAIFTFAAVAYSTTRAATQTKVLAGQVGRKGVIRLENDEDDSEGPRGVSENELVITSQPKAVRKDGMRYQALLAAVEAGSLPASVLDEEAESDDENDGNSSPVGEDRDDERNFTKYNYSWFHIIFILASMYVAGLLTDWKVVYSASSEDSNADVYIGRSESAMWMRIVSSWLCMGMYLWSLFAPVLMPDRFGDI